MAYPLSQELEKGDPGIVPSENLVVNIPLGAEPDRPLPVKHAYVSPVLRKTFLYSATINCEDGLLSTCPVLRPHIKAHYGTTLEYLRPLYGM
jgi:hypothetical protein